MRLSRPWIPGGALRKRLGFTSALLRRLGVQVSPPEEVQIPGLLVVQIDGLSAPRLRRCLNRATMPFLSKLVRRKSLKLHSYFSQLPTSTPAFQAGCFYGTNDNIPGFQFYDRKKRRLYKMGNTASAQAIQEEFPGPGLLRGGSVYSSVFDGGANGSLFIFSSLLDPRRWRFALRLWDLFVLLLLHLGLFLRILILALVELVLALGELPHWWRRTGRFMAEFQLVLIRVGLLIIGREMITLNALMDIQRGVPVIYINYLGYDEKSHYRGPDSAEARLQLRAIDRCLRRLVREARRSERPYQLLVLSDHGQAACTSFESITGKPVGPWLEELLKSCPSPEGQSRKVELEDGVSRENLTAEEQAKILRRLQPNYPPSLQKPVERVARIFEKAGKTPSPDFSPGSSSALVVAVSGPTAHIYWPDYEEPLIRQQIDQLHPGLLEQLRNCPALGCVSVRDRANNDILVFGHDGFAMLHSDGSRTLVGSLPPEHTARPQWVWEGINRIARFPRSGDLILWGNGSPSGTVSFLAEKGCHAGFSDEETMAFVLAPTGLEVDFSAIHEHRQFFQVLQTLRPTPGSSP